jgi:hypothetical protein
MSLRTFVKLGEFFERLRGEHLAAWKTGLFVFLAVLVLLNLFILPPHAEYGPDAWPGFWAAFGLAAALLMVWVMEKLVQPLIKRTEEKDDD